ncbi:collagen alpha-1(II) chain-like [Pan troglodytes]|uniref:collagen alpha-1(II) chain-like n=1 Tax=Pan troglodytes TaxID=9598 RepID=UPI00301385E2
MRTLGRPVLEPSGGSSRLSLPVLGPQGGKIVTTFTNTLHRKKNRSGEDDDEFRVDMGNVKFRQEGASEVIGQCQSSATKLRRLGKESESLGPEFQGLWKWLPGELNSPIFSGVPYRWVTAYEESRAVGIPWPSGQISGMCSQLLGEEVLEEPLAAAVQAFRVVGWRYGWGLSHSGGKELQLRNTLLLGYLYSIIVHLEGCRRFRAQCRGSGGAGEGRREGGFLPPHTQSPSRIYRVSRLGAERLEPFPCGWSASRSLGEGAGFRGPLVGPHPRAGGTGIPGSPALALAEPTRSKGRDRTGGGPGGRARLGSQGGAVPGGTSRRVGVRPGGRREAFAEALPPEAAPGCTPIVTGRLRAVGVGGARQGGARGGCKGQKAGKDPARLMWGAAPWGLGTQEERRGAESHPGLLGPWGYSWRERESAGATCETAAVLGPLPVPGTARAPSPGPRSRSSPAPSPTPGCARPYPPTWASPGSWLTRAGATGEARAGFAPVGSFRHLPAAWASWGCAGEQVPEDSNWSRWLAGRLLNTPSK